jgi:pimeloyl-ACP methyl ester carboxylesterase
MKKFFIYLSLILTIWLLLANFFILKNRWSNAKAYSVFKTKQVPLHIYDTLIDGINMHYAISGKDSLPTLVFIHGSPGSWMHYMKFMWDSTMRTKYRMIAIDRPGFGYSNFGETYHLAEQAKLILPILKSAKQNKPMFLMGHSMGGPVAVKLAADAPDLFDAVVIVAGSIAANEEKEEIWRIILNKKPLHYLLPGAFAPSNKELLLLKDDLILLQSDF